MKKIVALLLLASFQSFTFPNSSVDNGVKPSNPNNIEIINDSNYKVDLENSKIIGVHTFKKRLGITNFDQLTLKEQSLIQKKAAKLKCCKIVCVFDYNTPIQLKNFDIEKEENKKNYFFFYFIQETSN